MPGRIVKAFTRLNPRREPEDSIALRISVLAGIIIAELTILAMGFYDAATSLAIPLLTAAGFYVSWKRRRRRNLVIKLVLSLLVLAAAAIFLRELMASFYDTRLPLVKLFLWLQVLHSFDLPARKDLRFSLVSGLILITAGAVLSTGMGYIVGLSLFSVCTVVALIQFQASEETAAADVTVRAGVRTHMAASLVTWVALMAVVLPVMLLLPRTTQAQLHSLPLSDLQQILDDFTGEVINPYYAVEGDPFAGPPRFSSESYYGFAPYMDLRSRGRLSDDIVLKVRSDGYSFYRGIAFDQYNGLGWVMTSEEGEEIEAERPPFELPFDMTLSQSWTRVQSIYVQQELPNIIFTGWRPVTLFFPADRIKIDRYDSLRSPSRLTEDTVYTVVTQQPILAGETLRRFPRPSDAEADAAYTQLPEDNAGDLLEIEKLTRKVTRGYDNRYDQVVAIERYLKANYRYDLDIEPQSSGRDASAYFLFEEQAGYCEHFASAMAVMARSIGIPARVVTGYTGGSYNPFTGLWEVRQSDAHAWVEIYFGKAGWVPFDPTPGFEYPAGDAQGQSRFVIGRVLSYMRGILELAPVAALLGAAGAAAGTLLAAATRLPLPALGLAAAAVLALTAAICSLYRRATRERRRMRRLAAGLDPDYMREPELRNFLRLMARMWQLGLVRQPDETLREYSLRASRYLKSPEIVELYAIVERLRYANTGVDAGGRLQARALAAAVAEQLRELRGATAPS